MTTDSPRSEPVRTPSRLARRGFIVGGVVLLGSVGAARWFNVGARIEGGGLSAPDAFAAVERGLITLVDIRRPDEWARTGVPMGALPLDMRRDDFTQALLAQPGVSQDTLIALICARGVRSRGMSKRLVDAGFTNIIDVPEGMMGSGAGPGWLARGLPVMRP